MRIIFNWFESASYCRPEIVRNSRLNINRLFIVTITFPSIISKGRNFYLISFRCTIFIYLFIYFFPRIRKYGFYIFVRCGTRSYNATLIFEKRKINYLSGQSWKTRRDSDRKFNWNERTRFGNWKNSICIYIYIQKKNTRKEWNI